MNECTLVEVSGSFGYLRALRALFAEPGRGFDQRELAAEAGLDRGDVARLLPPVTRRQPDGLPHDYTSTSPPVFPLIKAGGSGGVTDHFTPPTSARSSHSPRSG